MINQIPYVVIAYLIGSISFGILASKIFSITDPRKMGSRNPGATNVLRTGNKKAAFFTLFGDMLKAFLVVGSAIFFNISHNILIAISIAVLIGHMYPIYYRFKGGKGVATALGILLAINWMLALAVMVVWLSVFYLSKYSSLSAITAAASSPLIAYAINQDQNIIILSILITLLVIFRHRNNIRNLLNGTESGFQR